MQRYFELVLRLFSSQLHVQSVDCARGGVPRKRGNFCTHFCKSVGGFISRCTETDRGWKKERKIDRNCSPKSKLLFAVKTYGTRERSSYFFCVIVCVCDSEKESLDGFLFIVVCWCSRALYLFSFLCHFAVRYMNYEFCIYQKRGSFRLLFINIFICVCEFFPFFSICCLFA